MCCQRTVRRRVDSALKPLWTSVAVLLQRRQSGQHRVQVRLLRRDHHLALPHRGIQLLHRSDHRCNELLVIHPMKAVVIDDDDIVGDAEVLVHGLDLLRNEAHLRGVVLVGVDLRRWPLG